MYNLHKSRYSVINNIYLQNILFILIRDTFSYTFNPSTLLRYLLHEFFHYFQNGDICEIAFLADHYAVVTQGSCTVLKVSFGTLKCLFCTGKSDCQHIIWMNSLLSKYDSCDLPEVLDQILNRPEDYRKKDQYQLKCESYEKIPFRLSHHMKGKISTQAKDLFLQEDGKLKAISMDMTCPYCKKDLPPDCLEENRLSKLFTKYTSFEIMCKYIYTWPLDIVPKYL